MTRATRRPKAGAYQFEVSNGMNGSGGERYKATVVIEARMGRLIPVANNEAPPAEKNDLIPLSGRSLLIGPSLEGCFVLFCLCCFCVPL